MRGLNLSTLLSFLPAVGPVVAALPEFKRLYDEIVHNVLEPKDQPTAKRAYELAIQESDQAHNDLQALVRERSGGAG